MYVCMLGDSFGRLNTIDPPPLSSRSYSFGFTPGMGYVAGTTVDALQASCGMLSDRARVASGCSATNGFIRRNTEEARNFSVLYTLYVYEQKINAWRCSLKSSLSSWMHVCVCVYACWQFGSAEHHGPSTTVPPGLIPSRLHWTLGTWLELKSVLCKPAVGFSCTGVLWLRLTVCYYKYM